jgi:pimeloyl-ACP methyl ester carboxylesterase
MSPLTLRGAGIPVRVASTLFLVMFVALFAHTGTASAALTWRGEQTISGAFSRGPDIASGEHNDVTAVWMQSDANHALVASDIGGSGTWSTPFAIPDTSNAEDALVVKSRNGHVAVAWLDGDQIGVSIRMAGGSFGSATLLGSNAGSASNDDPSIAINANGDVIVGWRHISGGGTSTAQVAEAFAGGAFGGVQTVSGNNAQQPAVGIDDSANAIVLFNKEDIVGDQDDIYEARSIAGGAFGASFRIDDLGADWVSASSRPRVAVNGQGKVVAAWEGTCANSELDCAWGRFVVLAQGTTTGSLAGTRATDPRFKESVEAEVAIDNDGQGAVVWELNSGGATDSAMVSETNILGGWANAVGVGPLHAGKDNEVSVAASSGRTVVTWVDQDAGAAHWDAYVAEGTIGTFTDDWTSRKISSSTYDADSIAVTTSDEGRAAAIWRNTDDDSIRANQTTAPVANGLQPIVVVPGVMGSILECGTDEVFPNGFFPEFEQFMLKSDGLTNQAGSCSSRVAANGHLRDTYDAVMAFFNDVADDDGRLVYGYGYDWRHSPDQNVAGLAALIEQAKQQSGSDQVMLVAYSMGGIVTQLYIHDPAQAANVSRLVTVETPYWGSMMPWLALSHGTTETIADAVIWNPSLHRFAQNASGLFSLYPSANLNRAVHGWLKVPLIGDNGTETEAGVVQAAAGFGATTSLVKAAQNLHKNSVDGFTTNGVDVHAIVSSGLPTIGRITEVFPGFLDHQIAAPSYNYVDGDEVVPFVSQMQGGVIGNPNPNPLGDDVSFELICGGSHGSDAADRMTFPILTSLLKSNDETATFATVRSCPKAAINFEITVDFQTGASGSGSSSAKGPRLSSKLVKLAKAGRIAVWPSGSHSLTIVTLDGKALKLPVLSNRAIVRKISRSKTGVYSTGAPQNFDASSKSMTLSLAPGGVIVKSGSKRIRPKALDRKAPTLRLRSKVKGSKVTFTVMATDRSGVAAIYVRIGTGKATKLRGHTLKVAKAKRHTVSFVAVDKFGNTSKAKKG